MSRDSENPDAVPSPFDSDDEIVESGDAGSTLFTPGAFPTNKPTAPTPDSAADAADPDESSAETTLFGVGGGAGTKPASTRKPATTPASPSTPALGLGSPSRPASASQSGQAQRIAEELSNLHGQYRYTPKREVGRGGMGRVLLAMDEQFEREVAIKELLPGKGGGAKPLVGTDGSLSEAAARFLREARVTGSLEHPGIIPVYEIGERRDGSVFYTMKFVRGQSLNDALRQINTRQDHSPTERMAERLKLLDRFVDICDAIAYAHSRGVIHRDLKPDNVMLGDFGETLVVDWGLAKLRTEEEKEKSKDETRTLKRATRHLLPEDIAAAQGKEPEQKTTLWESDEPMTKEATTQRGKHASTLAHALDAYQPTLDGNVLGTPAYMPPEQARGDIEAVDELSDLYSLGAIL